MNHGNSQKSVQLDGKNYAEDILRRLEDQPTPKRCLAVLVMEDDADSFGFVKIKERIAARLGVDFRITKISTDTGQEAVENTIKTLANDPDCGGIILQLPLSEKFKENQLANTIPQEKDVDLLSGQALGALYQGDPAVLPPAAGTIKAILKMQDISISKTDFAVVGAGRLVGKPAVAWLAGRTRKVTIYEKGADLADLSTADVVISGTGQPGLIAPNMLAANAGVIDFGYGRKNGTLSGDLDTTNKTGLEKLGFYTPTPGGTGPILVAKLFENFYQLNK